MKSERIVAELERRLGWLPPTAARATVGWVFLESGWGKLHDLDGVVKFFAGLGIPAPQLQAPFVAGTELVGGALLLLGLATRLASPLLMGVMAVALLTALREQIHSVSDLFALSEFGFLVLLAGLAVFGAGPLSLDVWLYQRLAARDVPGAAIPCARLGAQIRRNDR